MTRLFLAAGEASGDLQASLLAAALRRRDPTIELFGLGGERMERAGVRLVQRCDEMGVTGLWEVLRHLPRLRKILDAVASEMRRIAPDALVPIDYPDFNLRLAARAGRSGIPVVYYISPQIWAWRKNRIEAIRRFVRRMIVIFPFEEEIYRRAGIAVTYVGHPLYDRVRPERPPRETRRLLGIREGESLVVLMPGSRQSEIERLLPVLLRTRRLLRDDRDLRWALAVAPGVPEQALAIPEEDRRAILVRSGETYDLMAAADLVVTASGTATLEGALLGAPMLVLYRMHPVTWAVARRLVRVPHVAMANLIAGERLVPEFLQGDADPAKLAPAIRSWIDDADLRRRTSRRLREAIETLGPGGAPDRAARAILDEVAGSG